ITGMGTVAVSNLQSTPAANLTNISTAVFTASGVLSADVTFTGNLGEAAVTLTSANSTTRTFTVAPTIGNLQDAGGSISVGNGVILKSAAVATLNGVTASTTGTGVINLASLNGAAALSGLTGNVSAVVAANSLFTGNLGSIRPTVNEGFTLTIGNGSSVGNAQFNGAGAVVITDDALAPISNL
ncbi:MAG: hypothetical protein NTW02_03905, partial [Cyanobium sp. LacPavin_0920_WC12_MAG_62_9]|nr:hypothetical protein [Cyanobium sp. LacPavin_0920_WC12_MAG_62_9]